LNLKIRAMDRSRSALEARSVRFAREAANPPPAPVRTMAWAGGKLTTNKEAALRKFLARKGDELSDEARARAEQAALQPRRPQVLRSTAGNAMPRQVEAPPAVKIGVDKAAAKLRKKLSEIEQLEARASSGEALEHNQLAKIARKAELLAMIA
jgi:uncharacterized protein with WD repeat